VTRVNLARLGAAARVHRVVFLANRRYHAITTAQLRLINHLVVLKLLGNRPIPFSHAILHLLRVEILLMEGLPNVELLLHVEQGVVEITVIPFQNVAMELYENIVLAMIVS